MTNGTDKNKNEMNKVLEMTIRQNADLIYRLAYQYIGNFSDAQDILQEVSLSLVTGNPPFDDEIHLRNWICKVTINKCRNFYKHNKKIEWEELREDIVASESEPLSLKSEVMSLPHKYRIVLYLYYYEKYSIKEISQILRINMNTVGARLRRGREKLKIILTEGE